MLKVKDNSFFEPCAALPKILWLSVNTEANGWPGVIYRPWFMCYGWLHKFEARNPRDKKLAVIAKDFAVVHYDTVIRKHHLSGGSRFIGGKGEKLVDLHLEVLGVRLQLDSYKTRDYYVDQSVLAADADGNRFPLL